MSTASSSKEHPQSENGDEKNRWMLTVQCCRECDWNTDPQFHSVVIKVGMVGDSQIGKTSLMVKYVEGSFDEDYIQTLGPSSLLSLSITHSLF